MQDIKSLKPFTRFLMTIGELPSSYLISMTYEEQLLWFCNYLEKTVIPTVNNNAEAVIELQNYIKNYFDNLDVQEEINNKLDEMAESGELTDIIAQYLELAGVLAYNTKADLKAASNITDGSICKTLGNTTYNDGYGNFYKIRAITSGDVVDDDNILALTISDTLIAEKIPNGYINDINTNISNIEDDIDDINSAERCNGILGLTRIGSEEHWSLVYSNTGKEFYPVGNILNSSVGDSSSITEINGEFYIVGSNRYRHSKDLKNWSNDIEILHGYTATTYPRVWASTFTYDEVNNIVYCYSAYQTADEDFALPIINESTGHYPFKIIYQTGTINDDGTITFDQTIHTLLEENDESYYDPFVIKDPIHGLLFACVKSSTLQVQIRNMTDYTTIGSDLVTCPINGIEAPQLISDGNGNVYCYVDCQWTFTNTYLNKGNSSPHINGYFTVANTSGLCISKNMRLIPYKIFSNKWFRHLGITNISKNGLKYAEALGIKIVPTHYSSDFNIQNGRGSYTSANGGVINNSPCVIWNCPSGATVDLKLIFKEEPVVFQPAGNGVTWSNDSDVPSYAKGKTFQGKWSRHQVTVYPPADNDTIDMPFTN